MFRGSNNDGVWNEIGSWVKVTIVPPFWATGWFRGLVLLVLVGGIAGGYRLRVRSVEARSRELEVQVEQRTTQLRQETEYRMQVEKALQESEMEKAVAAERNRLARDLHDSVTQSMYSLTLIAEAGQRMIATRDLEQIEGNQARLADIAQQALQEMRLLVYELRPKALESEGLIGALEQRLEIVERRAGVQARIIVQGEIELRADVEEDLYRIAQEALNNALKHAKAAKVELTIRVVEKFVILKIVDDGQGFDPETMSEKGGLGLVNMQERANRMGGEFAILSAPGAGTTIVVKVKGGSDE
jgi:signal transduction histidine kinase